MAVTRTVFHKATPHEVLPAATSRRQAGLWFSSLSVRVEPVKKAHKRPCATCGNQPADVGDRRLLVKRGAGRRAVSAVYCAPCGVDVARRFREEADRVISHINDGFTMIRLPGDFMPKKDMADDAE